ncbi:hypothetical protein [Dyadobacter sp. CY356]|uniref:hypothetical protein n=1 Tax=Dyadobacter sp. CY356 TaxID=2906442 RepID=UPI001F23FB97|nr:hypothetical protein [Dyadobacter sp. CY356]MCF0057076.1 hypothetical protein [Dyadobacter sp. CY356]
MSKSNILTPAIFSFLFLTAVSGTQAQTITDPGFSTHNYKMPNQAAKAKMEETGHFSVVMNSLPENQAGSLSKYALRPASIVVAMDDKKVPMSINPLSSVSNYKTQPVSKMQSAHDEYSASLN